MSSEVRLCGAGSLFEIIDYLLLFIGDSLFEIDILSRLQIPDVLVSHSSKSFQCKNQMPAA